MENHLQCLLNVMMGLLIMDSHSKKEKNRHLVV